ncbi:MAG: IclR family transcriptional regulator [Halanaerobiales bacterium]|nr:IclR family transcriptional regulator [Halanaerobiales bacterium]
MSNKGIIKSVQKSLKVLRYIMAATDEVSVNELVEEFGYNRSTVHHMLKTMKVEGFITQNQRTKNYNIGSEIFNGWIKDRDMHNYLMRLKPIIKEIVEKCKETTTMFVRENDRAICVLGEESEQIIKAYLMIGREIPLYCTAAGRAMLAYLPEDEVEKILQISGMKKYMKKTTVDKNELYENLAEVKDKGYAIEKEEFEELINAVGIPILNKENRPVASVSVVGPIMRFTEEKMKECIPFLLEKSKEMSDMVQGKYYR